MFKKILIANRGEIACRVIKTLKKMGIESVAIYSTADIDSLHVSLADSAFCVGGPNANDSYLNIDNIIAAAIKCKADAIHPGYGFLSENPNFAKAATAANIVFIGPTIKALEAMGSKQVAKKILEKTKVPLTPGYHGDDQSDKTLEKKAKELGFPVLIKAANGGGGKGMRTVHDETLFLKDLASARREALSSFADSTMIIEKLIKNPRHIEIQIMADNFGNIVHLYERDCSIQRRHQKIIEEAPAPNLAKKLKENLAKASVSVAKEINYLGAGTIEFLVEGDNFYFMEMNTRLQVEHPVTEMITNLDLVEWQIRIAANEKLPLSQKEINAHGHAIECRIYAEDPIHDFMPSMGSIHFLKEPSGDGIRIDTGVKLNSNISRYYDPMIAKLIAYGDDRTEALNRLQLALKHYHIGGVKTNIPFLQAIINHPKFLATKLNTNFLSQEKIEILQPNKQVALLMAASVDYLELRKDMGSDSLKNQTFGWQMHLKTSWRTNYIIDNEEHVLTITPISNNELKIFVGSKHIELQAKLTDDKLFLTYANQELNAFVEIFKEKIIFYTDVGPIEVLRFNWEHKSSFHNELSNQLTAPMPATVVAILKNIGDKIKAGERIIVLEAMKMEHAILAPNDGILIDIFYDLGAQVNEGALLAKINDKE